MELFKKIKCLLGFHQWAIIGPTRVEGETKYTLREIGDGKCENCGEEAEVGKDYYY